MKSVYSSITLFLLTALLLFGGCSSNTVHPVVSQDSKVSRDKALIVMGVSYWELYNDTQDEEEKKLFSADLLKDKKRVKGLLDKKDGTRLDLPLHYLSRFQFQFLAPGDARHEFVRFDLDTREYEPVAIHEFIPGPVRLVGIATDQHRYEKPTHARGQEERWKKHWVNYEESYGSWELQQGRVTYLGHLTMYFKTRRFVLGLLTPEELVERTDLVAITIEDRFEEVKQQLQEKKPWFPVTEMENQSRPGKWVYDEAMLEEFNEAPATDAEKDKGKKIKRDIKKYFF